VTTWKELITIFKIANGKKAIAPTQYNPASTRGHCILVFEADMPHPTKRGVRRAGRLYVCDLAGAEPAASGLFFFISLFLNNLLQVNIVFHILTFY